jgi:hypothetical protein
MAARDLRRIVDAQHVQVARFTPLVIITVWLFDVHQAPYQPLSGAIFSLIYINSAFRPLAKVTSYQAQ